MPIKYLYTYLDNIETNKFYMEDHELGNQDSIRNLPKHVILMKIFI